MEVYCIVNRTVKLETPTQKVLLSAPLAYNNTRAHSMQITVVDDDGLPEDLTGVGATGNFLKSDGTTVTPITCTITENVVRAILPPSCYVTPGRFSFTLDLTKSNTTRTALWVDGYVDRNVSGTIVDPGTPVTNYSTIISNANAAATAATNAASAANTAAAAAQSVADSVEEDISDLKSKITVLGDGKLFATGDDTASVYYKSFETALLSGTKYRVKVTAHVAGTYDVQFSTSGSASGIVDTISSVAFAKDVPLYFEYTPSADVTWVRLWACTDWGIDIYTFETAWNAIETVQEQANATDQIIVDAFDKIPNKNLFNDADVIKDKRYNTSGALVSEPGWDTSGAIPVNANETVYFSAEISGTRGAVTVWYLILLSTDGTTVLDYTNAGVTSYTPASNGILHYTWKYNANRSDEFCGTISNPAYYDTYGYSYALKQAAEPKPYNGIVWACVGDSLTEYNSAAEMHYFDYIADELGFTVKNYGVSGTGYAAGIANNHAFYQRIAAITGSFDVLTILGSVNDIELISTMGLGTYTDTGTSTIAGCINSAIDSFYSIAPFKKIGIISQPPSIGTANNGNLSASIAQQYNDLLGQICANRGIPFLDLYNCSGLRPWDSDYRAEYYTENGVADTGVHPNSKGQKQMSTKIREFIKTVI